MKFKEFSEEAVPVYPVPNKNPLYLCMALGGETGELLNVMKKIYRDEDRTGKLDERLEDFKEEAGDVLFYLKEACLEMGFTLDEVAEHCIEKLEYRRKKYDNRNNK